MIRIRLLATTTVLLLLPACGQEAPPAAPPAPADFVAAQRGRVSVLLLGMQSCPGTRAATEVLAGMDFPEDVTVARFDVPPPDGEAPPIGRWPHPWHYAVDADRAVAGRLEFFYYPTLYVLDRDGEVRYSGACEQEKLAAMVAEIRAEAPGGEKKLYTPPLPAVGEIAPDLPGVACDDGPTLVFFTSEGCPFSTKAREGLPRLEEAFEGQPIAVKIVEKTDAEETFRAFRVDPVPFYFVIAADGTVAARGPYTEAAAASALAAALGIETPKVPAKGEGAG